MFVGGRWVSQGALVVKNPPANAGDVKDSSLIAGLGRSFEDLLKVFWGLCGACFLLSPSLFFNNKVKSGLFFMRVF